MGSTSGIPKSFRKRFEALETKVDSNLSSHQSLVSAIKGSAGKKSRLRKVMELYHRNPISEISKTDLIDATTDRKKTSKKNRTSFAERIEKLKEKSGRMMPSKLQNMLNGAMIGMHIAVLDHYLSENEGGKSLYDFLADQKNPIEAHRLISSIKSNTDAIVDKNLEDLEELGYFSGLKIQNPELAGYFLNTIITVITGKALDFDDKTPEQYLEKLPDYRKDTLKAVLEGKLNAKNFNSEDFASDPANESVYHIQTVMKNNAQLMTLATLEMMKETKEKAPDKLKNLTGALNMKL